MIFFAGKIPLANPNFSEALRYSVIPTAIQLSPAFPSFPLLFLAIPCYPLPFLLFLAISCYFLLFLAIPLILPSHIPSILPTYLKQSLGYLSKRTIFPGLHHFFKHILVMDCSGL